MSEQVSQKVELYDPDLEEFYEKAWLAQRVLDTMKDPVEVQKWATQVEVQLAKIYPYYQQEVFASGYGVAPTKEDGKFVKQDRVGHIDGVSGTHIGFKIVQLTDEDDVDRFYLFHTILAVSQQEIDREVATLRQYTLPIFYLNLGSVVLPVADLEKIYQHNEYSNLAQEIGALGGLSEDLVDIFQSAEFRNLSQHEQQEIIDSFLAMAEESVSLRSLPFIVETTYCYKPVVTNDQPSFLPMDLSHVVISGICLGLDTPEAVSIKYGPLRTDQDFIDIDAGLCYVIDPDKDTRLGLQLNPDQVLFIPMGDQKVEFSINVE